MEGLVAATASVWWPVVAVLVRVARRKGRRRPGLRRSPSRWPSELRGRPLAQHRRLTKLLLAVLVVVDAALLLVVVAAAVLVARRRASNPYQLRMLCVLVVCAVLQTLPFVLLSSVAVLLPVVALLLLPVDLLPVAALLPISVATLLPVVASVLALGGLLLTLPCVISLPSGWCVLLLAATVGVAVGGRVGVLRAFWAFLLRVLR